MDLTGWGVHGTVLGVLAVLAGVFTLMDHFGRSSGGWISLRGVLSVLVWIGLAVFAAVSTILVALLREVWGLVPCYLLALPFSAALWFVPNVLDNRRARRRYAVQRDELFSRFELLSWCPHPLEPGRLRLTAEIRALRDVEVRFEGAVVDGAGATHYATPKPEPVRLTAGQTARLETVFPISSDHPVAQHILQFRMPTPVGTEGEICYDEVKADLDAGEWHWRRPLPPPKRTSTS
jgi:hypothetical protein